VSASVVFAPAIEVKGKYLANVQPTGSFLPVSAAAAARADKSKKLNPG
jgi:hypothetical protein